MQERTIYGHVGRGEFLEAKRKRLVVERAHDGKGAYKAPAV